MEADKEGFRDRISTVNEKGKRVWIYPKKPAGWFYNKRKWVSYFLLTTLFVLPHINYQGEQFFMLNILERKFVIFGQVFWPQDFFIFAIALIVGLIFVTLFTVIFGRLFCGWICPQTIFMEMLFRRVEYWIEGDWTHQKKLKEMPWNREKILKRTAKLAIFWGLSFLIANTFLAYIIGADRLWEIQRDPVGEHISGLIAIIVFTTVFFIVYQRLREQICTTICPYGRLQGVLLDKHTIVVGYDYRRGENRAKFKKNEDRLQEKKGDCIDCRQCVNVCPTGIDIRNGTQLECINCTACIDACDHMMESVGLQKGLIRFVSEDGIKNNTRFKWTKRVKAYTAVLIVLIGVLITLVVTRKDFEASIIRQRGTTYQVTSDGKVSNIFEINLLNKTRRSYDVKLQLLDKNGSIETVVDVMKLPAENQLKERFVVKLPFAEMVDGKKIITIEVLGNGKRMQVLTTKFIGPSL